MNVISTAIPEVLIIEPKVFGDSRGFFFESFNQRDFNAATGTDFSFVQDNHSRSEKGVLRGLHYQINQPQGKLVRATHGTVFDVAVDMRRSSLTFGQWVGVELSEDNRLQMWIPPGFAHGLLVTSNQAEVQYKASQYYSPENERCIAWNDSQVAVAWPLQSSPIISPKDNLGVAWQSAEMF